MVDAPEKIWAFHDGPMVGLFIGKKETGTNISEYIRADLVAHTVEENLILECQIAELRAEVAEHKRLKNQLVLKAYPAMDAIDEIAEGFRSAVHFVRNNAMNMERDYPEICHAEEVFSRVRAALAGKE